MASVLKAQSKIATKSHKDAVTVSRKRVERDEDEIMMEASGEPPKKKRNKQRVLMLCSRGVTHRMRHLMNDLEALLPHVKKGPYFLSRTLFTGKKLKLNLVFQTRSSVLKTPSWIRKTTLVYYLNSQIYTTAIIRSISKLGGTKTFTYGPQKRRMDLA